MTRGASAPCGRLQASDTYILWVDGDRGTAGTHELDVTRIPEAANETCNTAEGLVFESGVARATRSAQYSPLITKNEPRIVPASFDFCFANLKRGASSAGTSIPSESLKPTARFPLSSIV